MNEKGEPVLIAECKLWKGEKLLLDAIDQLLNTYVNWRDEKIALIIFNRDVQKFSLSLIPPPKQLLVIPYAENISEKGMKLPSPILSEILTMTKERFC